MGKSYLRPVEISSWAGPTVVVALGHSSRERDWCGKKKGGGQKKEEEEEGRHFSVPKWALLLFHLFRGC